MRETYEENYRGYTIKGANLPANKVAAWVQLTENQTSRFYTAETWESARDQVKRVIDSIQKAD